MKQCAACDRHLFGEEERCPFCGAAQHTATASSVSPVLTAITLMLGLGMVACGPQVPELFDEGSSTSTTSTSVATTSSAMSTSSSSSSSSVGPMTLDDTSTTAIDTSASTDDGDDAPCAFYACRPDGGLDPSECDTFAQDCPVGEKCMPWSTHGGAWDATRCVPVTPDPSGVGEPCTAIGGASSGFDDCALGLMCFHVDSKTEMGTCISLCDGSLRAPTCPEVGEACSITNDDSLAICLPACNPLAGDCPAGEGCYPVSDDELFVCYDTAIEAVHGEPCEYINGCASGYVCVNGGAVLDCESAGCCTTYCDTIAGPPCPDAELGMICDPWYEDGMAPPGYETVGGCALPP